MLRDTDMPARTPVVAALLFVVAGCSSGRVCQFSSSLGCFAAAPKQTVTRAQSKAFIESELRVVNGSLGLDAQVLVDAAPCLGPAQARTENGARWIEVNDQLLSTALHARESDATWAMRGVIAHEAAHLLL